MNRQRVFTNVVILSYSRVVGEPQKPDMFKLEPRTSFEVPPDQPDVDDDDISLTSTIPEEHDPDEEFEVEEILAEDKSPNGKMYYLIKWAGFPLHESTWEPEDNIKGNELLPMWEEEKARQRAGLSKPFELSDFHEAQARVKREHQERHRRRNAKRKRLGLPLTPPFDDEDITDNEAQEISEIEDLSPKSVPLHKTRPPIPAKRTKASSGSETVRRSSASSLSGLSKAQRNESRRSSIGDDKSSSRSSSSTKRDQAVPPPGVSRKPSKTPGESTIKAAISSTSVPKQPDITGAKSKLKAKRSAVQPAGNIFVSGKIINPRPNLTNAMSDPTKEPKLFHKHHYRRLAEKRSRDTEDIAPADPSKLPVPLFNLSKGPDAIRRSSASNGKPDRPGLFVSQSDSASPVTPVNPSLTTTVPSAAPPALRTFTTDEPAKKKRKSVRFLDDDVPPAQEPEPMDIDSPGNRQNSIVDPPEPGVQPARPCLDFDSWKRPPETQSTQKRLIAGKISLQATFNNLPKEELPQHEWLNDFLSKETIEFTHSCFVNAVATQLSWLLREPLACGTIVSSDHQILDQVAEYLTAGLLGLYCGKTEYNIIVYPAKCDDWKTLPLGQEPENTNDTAVLRFFIFVATQDCRLMLPPLPDELPVPSTPAAETEQAEDTQEKKKPEKNDRTKSEQGVVPTARTLLMKRFFGLEYEKLFPADKFRLKPDTFFLAVPRSRQEPMKMIYHWLRDCNPECQVYNSLSPGSWQAFRARVEANAGVIIIHESLAWSLRRFPDLSKFLRGKKDEYWCLTEPMHRLPMYPSIAPSENARPGEMRLIRLFPYRTVIMLTPSFMVTAPRQTFELLSWFTAFA